VADAVCVECLLCGVVALVDGAVVEGAAAVGAGDGVGEFDVCAIALSGRASANAARASVRRVITG
jgi:hypothetical protein